jgi:hypothetical protein
LLIKMPMSADPNVTNASRKYRERDWRVKLSASW